ncbi:hypothetical protein [Streptomyces sp. NPDC008137]|uniref:hypothetical protein n=1 Tax=Streptomyces sp. NPDC008137 TaxID=3364813 RepID=UPI0036F03032
MNRRDLRTGLRSRAARPPEPGEAARELGTTAVIVMLEDAPPSKRAATAADAMRFAFERLTLRRALGKRGLSGRSSVAAPDGRADD